MNESLSPQPLTPQQVERIRLLLSTYQDGTGQKLKKHADTLPDWRHFERAVAVAMGGRGTENKGLFDVLMPAGSSSPFGISCKMRMELGTARRRGIVTVEVANAAGESWNELRAIGISTTPQMAERADEAGAAILNLAVRWAAAAKQAHQLSLSASYFLVLLWSNILEYQLYQMSLVLPDPATLTWSVRASTKEGKEESGCLVGNLGERRVIEWYGDSGGQLKYYPEVSEALWQSDVFRLEPLPFAEDGYGTANKARTFFPELWARAADDVAPAGTT